MKRIRFLIIAMLCTTGLFAQNETDALRYIQVFPGGTSRMMGMGGAFGAFGGDFSTLSINPAGIGVYRSSQFTITPSMNYQTTHSDFLGNSSEDLSSNFYLGNMGLVYSYLTGRTSGIVSFNFGFGYNRENDFNQNLIMRGINQNNSLLDYFAVHADGTSSDQLYPFEEGIAWDVYMLDTVVGQPLNYETVYSQWGDLPSSTYGQEQRRTISTTGGAGEYTYAVGVNLNNMLYMGGTFGIHRLNYHYKMDHFEVDPDGHIAEFDYFTFSENLDTKGSAYSLKLGFLLKPIQMLRIGGAVHLPYKYKIEENYFTSIESGFDTPDLNGNTVYNSSTDAQPYSYSVTSPLKVIGNAGLQLFKMLLVDVDLEYIDYSNMKMGVGSDNYDFFDENQAIKDAYKSVINWRAGAELKLGTLYLRAGTSFYGSPYVSSEPNKNANYMSYSGGLGFRNRNFSIDLAYIFSTHEEQYFMYQLNGVSPSVNKFQRHQIQTTFGFRF